MTWREDAERDTDGLFLVVGPENIESVLHAVIKAYRDAEIRQIGEGSEMKMYRCSVCNVAMLTQPAAMTFDPYTRWAKFFCADHASDPSTT